MKYSIIYLGFLLILCSRFAATAQVLPPVRQKLPQKAPLFTRLPDKSGINTLWIERIFASSARADIDFPLAGINMFKGVVMEKVRKNDHVVTMNIRSLNYDGAFLTISKIVNDDLSVAYIGRIISRGHEDALVLKKENGQFYFVKEKQSQVIVE